MLQSCFFLSRKRWIRIWPMHATYPSHLITLILSFCLRLDAPKLFLSLIKTVNTYLTHACHMSLPSHPYLPSYHKCSHFAIVFKIFYPQLNCEIDYEVVNELGYTNLRSDAAFFYEWRTIAFDDRIFYGLYCQIYWNAIYRIKYAQFNRTTGKTHTCLECHRVYLGREGRKLMSLGCHCVYLGQLWELLPCLCFHWTNG